ncbi:MAG: winged helix-turn-helix transcriptional regulator [Nitrososphaerota archaeon]|jgi:DNA-binding transcriptional ArsR family regulator|nr:winged helix-turn-helix domain-containing protein [Nitrososphaerota archaeon]MCL5672296.1 winged helix-turn-helix domain-containing protein [Nitrososphaerota archaeon]MDG6912337.1 winged helix-turn-helix transcriptional regulator [Nitrososphaerota archaeon]MDG6937404.1 winged helix-turn-helix transcriptional regulator [Nitrososphaerota archaeon]MDG6958636.1 winged helix-turn-helix transcriptional regulator [Nitrososphaerota archaeon]
MTIDFVEEVLSSKAKLRIMDAVSVRPRTLGELSDATGISVQGVLRHLKRLAELGLVEERGLSRAAPKARVVYAAASARVRDYSSKGLTVVRSADVRPRRQPARVRDLERAAGDLLIQRRRIGETARKLGRMIDEASEDQEDLAAAVASLGLSDTERLIVEVALTEDTLEEGRVVLSKYYGIEDRRSIERALSKAGRFV